MLCTVCSEVKNLDTYFFTTVYLNVLMFLPHQLAWNWKITPSTDSFWIHLYNNANCLAMQCVCDHLGTFYKQHKNRNIFQLFLPKRDRLYTKALSKSYFRSSRTDVRAIESLIIFHETSFERIRHRSLDCGLWTILLLSSHRFLCPRVRPVQIIVILKPTTY